MYLYDTQDEWLTEYCPLCGSVNHIFIPPAEPYEAWECWSCFNRWWMDDLAKSMFLIEHNIDEDEAEDWLCNAASSITFVFGQPER